MGRSLHTSIVDYSIEGINRGFIYLFYGDSFLGMNMACSSQTRTLFWSRLCAPSPPCELLYLSLPRRLWFLELSPRFYPLDQSQPGCGKGRLLKERLWHH